MWAEFSPQPSGDTRLQNGAGAVGGGVAGWQGGEIWGPGVPDCLER